MCVRVFRDSDAFIGLLVLKKVIQFLQSSQRTDTTDTNKLTTAAATDMSVTISQYVGKRCIKEPSAVQVSAS